MAVWKLLFDVLSTEFQKACPIVHGLALHESRDKYYGPHNINFTWSFSFAAILVVIKKCTELLSRGILNRQSPTPASHERQLKMKSMSLLSSASLSNQPEKETRQPRERSGRRCRGTRAPRVWHNYPTLPLTLEEENASSQHLFLGILFKNQRIPFKGIQKKIQNKSKTI